ncbi:DNA ligase 1 [Diachasma alloeum]|uniref:DNA ligase 1 n=1 Tax=Diachasma alloeum TaxID=454923 RepID=UPI00073838CF|nr:DNA ligase 1 [Diachasma alloeum]
MPKKKAKKAVIKEKKQKKYCHSHEKAEHATKSLRNLDALVMNSGFVNHSEESIPRLKERQLKEGVTGPWNPKKLKKLKNRETVRKCDLEEQDAIEESPDEDDAEEQEMEAKLVKSSDSGEKRKVNSSERRTTTSSVMSTPDGKKRRQEAFNEKPLNPKNSKQFKLKEKDYEEQEEEEKQEEETEEEAEEEAEEEVEEEEDEEEKKEQEDDEEEEEEKLTEDDPEEHEIQGKLLKSSESGKRQKVNSSVRSTAAGKASTPGGKKRRWEASNEKPLNAKNLKKLKFEEKDDEEHEEEAEEEEEQEEEEDEEQEEEEKEEEEKLTEDDPEEQEIQVKLLKSSECGKRQKADDSLRRIFPSLKNDSSGKHKVLKKDDDDELNPKKVTFEEREKGKQSLTLQNKSPATPKDDSDSPPISMDHLKRLKISNVLDLIKDEIRLLNKLRNKLEPKIQKDNANSFDSQAKAKANKSQGSIVNDLKRPTCSDRKTLPLVHLGIHPQFRQNLQLQLPVSLIIIQKTYLLVHLDSYSET